MKVVVFIFIFVISTTFANQEQFERGKKVYKMTCVSCHGQNGETNPQMSLVVKPRKLSKSILDEEQSYQVVKEGAHYWGAHADMMPTFKYVLSEQEMRDVTHYIVNAFNSHRDTDVAKLMAESEDLTPKQVAKMDKVGKKIFLRNCSMCHGDTGDGKSEYVEQSKIEENFMYPYNIQKSILNQDQIFLFIKYGGMHWGSMDTSMPAWKRKYDDVQLKSVAKYVFENIRKEHK